MKKIVLTKPTPLANAYSNGQSKLACGGPIACDCYNMMPRLDSDANRRNLTRGASKLLQAGKTVPRKFTVFLCPKTGNAMVGRPKLYNTHKGKAWGSPVAVLNLPTTLLNATSKLLQEPIMKDRKLTVRSGYYDHKIQGQHAYYLPPPVPFVLLKGYWLEEAKFDIGTPVIVEVRENQLILTAQPN